MNFFVRKSLDRSKPNRRDFLVQTGCTGMGITSLVNTLAQMKLVGSAAAQAGQEDYKALVCIFLNGGMDSNNFLIPAGSTSSARNAYVTNRGILAIPDSQFDDVGGAGSGISSRLQTPLNSPAYDPASGYTGGNLALHPAAAPLAGLFNSEQLAIISNIGTLTAPGVTRTNYSSAGTTQASSALLPLRPAGAMAVLPA